MRILGIRCRVIGISSDGSSLKKFKQQYKLPFILLSDEIKKFKIVWCTKALFGILPKLGDLRHDKMVLWF
jgi:peroxiredoxin